MSETHTDKLREPTPAAERAGDIAQQIQDLYFSLGARVDMGSWGKTEELLHFALLSERTRLEGLLPREKEQLDKNDPDNYGACYAIAGYNDCLREVQERLFGKTP